MGSVQNFPVGDKVQFVFYILEYREDSSNVVPLKVTVTVENFDLLGNSDFLDDLNSSPVWLTKERVGNLKLFRRHWTPSLPIQKILERLGAVRRYLHPFRWSALSNDLFYLIIYLAHLINLLAPFLVVVLIDTDRIYPHSDRL
jgi:hypothetical protein